MSENLASSARSLNHEFVRRYWLWLSILQYSNGVKQKYTKIAGEFCDLLGDRSVEKSTGWDVRRFLTLGCKKGHQHATAYRTLAAIRNFFDFLSLGGITAGIPVRMVRIKAPHRDPPVVASPATILRLIAAAKEPRERALVELLYATGCRASELVQIKAEDIDLESRKIQLNGKFGKSRYVVFGADARRAVRECLGGRTSGYLFRSAKIQKGSVYKRYSNNTWVGEVSVYTRTSPPERQRIVMKLGSQSEMSLAEAWSKFKKRIRGLTITRPMISRPMALNSIRAILYRLALRAGTRQIPPKEFRHCFATHMLDGGADIREIQELLGHACLTATQLYTHVSRQRLLEVFDRCHPRGNRCHAKSTSRIPS